MALFGKKKKKVPKPARKVQRARPRTRRTDARRVPAARTGRAGQAQNGMFITAGGKIYLFHRIKGWKVMARKDMDAAIKSAFGSK